MEPFERRYIHMAIRDGFLVRLYSPNEVDFIENERDVNYTIVLNCGDCSVDITTSSQEVYNVLKKEINKIAIKIPLGSKLQEDSDTAMWG